MKRNSVLGAAFALMTLAGCGSDSDKTSTPPRTGSEVARSTPATVPAAPRPSEPEVIVSDRRSSTERFRAAGRRWRGCGKTVYNSKTGYDLYGIAASGPLRCPAAVAVITALSEQVQRREAAAEPDVDCFPGYCRGDDGIPRPTAVAGYRCDATNNGDVSILLFIVCRNGNRYVSAGAADDE